MRKIFVFLLLVGGLMLASDFKWARAQFETRRPSDADQKELMETCDYGESGDLELLEQLEASTTIKAEKKVYHVSFKDLKEAAKFPLIFMHSSGYPALSDEELKNMGEYMKRGGLIYAEDCQLNPQNDYFFQRMKGLVQKKIFPGQKMIEIPLSHPLFNCHFKFPKGFPTVAGVADPFTVVLDDQNRIMMFLCSRDFHCGWYNKKRDPEQRKQAFQAAINIIVYAMTH